MAKLNARPDTQSRPENRRGTNSWFNYLQYMNTTTDQNDVRVQLYKMDGLLASQRLTKKVINLLEHDVPVSAMNGRVMRQVARNLAGSFEEPTFF